MKTMITALSAGLLVMMCVTQPEQSASPQNRGAGRGAAQAATPAPPPGSAGIYKSDAEFTAALSKAIAAANGEQLASPIANRDQYRINIVHREKAAGTLVHEGNTELHYIIQGSGVGESNWANGPDRFRQNIKEDSPKDGSCPKPVSAA